MPGVICTVAGGKGGVGRSTSALNAGAAFEQLGYDAAVIDADLAMADLGSMLGRDVETGLHSVLAGNATVSEATIEAPGGVTLLPGEESLDAYADADATALGGVIKTVSERFDIVFVDTEPGLGHALSVALGQADSVLLVTTAREPAMRDAAKIGDMADRVGGEVLGSVVTHVTDGDELEIVKEHLGVPVLGAIPADPDGTSAEPLMVKSLDSVAAKAYSRLASQLNRLYFDGATVDGLDPAFESAWLAAGDDSEDGAEESTTTDETTGETEAESGTSDDGSGDGELDGGDENGAADEDEDKDDDTNEFTGGALPFG